MLDDLIIGLQSDELADMYIEYMEIMEKIYDKDE